MYAIKLKKLLKFIIYIKMYGIKIQNINIMIQFNKAAFLYVARVLI